MIRHLRNKLERFVTLGGHANARTEQFLRYSVTGISSFGLDLLILRVLTETFHVYYLVSAVIAFIIGVSVNYITSREYAFRGSSRGLAGGYARFLGIALAGVVIIVLSMSALVENFGVPYMIARVIVACFVGVWNFTMNAFWNFRR